jgi:N-glycosyltransferase
VRVLATVNASPSHVRKFIPLVRSLVGAGHDVHFVTSEPMLRELAGEPVTSSTPLPDAYEGLAAFLRGMAAAEQAGASGGTESDDEPDQTANLNMLFGLEFWRQILPVVVDIAKDFKADLVLRDDFDAVGYLVAEQLGIPHLAMSGGSTILLDPSRLADPLAVHGQELGLAGSGRGLYGYGRVDYLPEEYSFTTHHWPVELRFRQPVLNRPGEVLPDWIAGLTPDRPLVYAALGTSLPMQAKLGREGVPLPSTIRPEFEVRQMIDALA